MTANSKRVLLLGTTGLLGLLGPACKGEGTGMKPNTAVADLQDADGASVGTATFEEAEGGVKVHVEVKNLPPGPHGVHVHEHGLCHAPTFESAGEHLNPTKAAHGLDNPDGPHLGDMPNLEVGQDGTGKLDFVLTGASLETSGANEPRSLLAGDSTALVVHEAKDDQSTDPSGMSGARIACGVVRRK